ncbi:hypothetical protein BC835DRAFT_667559 [Cytidiella melzeri]|nr:hypothetical protein BC835DRAFT_667559 [Cytidiella melzeri]
MRLDDGDAVHPSAAVHLRMSFNRFITQDRRMSSHKHDAHELYPDPDLEQKRVDALNRAISLRLSRTPPIATTSSLSKVVNAQWHPGLDFRQSEMNRLAVLTLSTRQARVSTVLLRIDQR